MTDARSALARVTPAEQKRKPREAKVEPSTGPKSVDKTDATASLPPKETKSSSPHVGEPAKPAVARTPRNTHSAQDTRPHKERKKPAHVVQRRRPQPVERSYRAGTRFTDIWVDRP